MHYPVSAWLQGLLNNNRTEKHLLSVDLEPVPGIQQLVDLAAAAGVDHRFRYQILDTVIFGIVSLGTVEQLVDLAAAAGMDHRFRRGCAAAVYWILWILEAGRSVGS